MGADDAVLVRRCLAGDESAMRALIERFQGAVFGLCYRMLGHRQDAEDVAQDVFLRLFRSLQRWDSTRPLKPWLMMITRNRCRTVIEKRSRYPVSTETIVRLAEQKGNPKSGGLAEELQLALMKLREEYRICFTLFHQQELSCEEIGEIMQCPQGTVKTWLHRARRELREHLLRRKILDYHT